MKTLLLSLLFVLFSIITNAQNSIDSVAPPLTREQKKAQKELEQQALFEKTAFLLNSRAYVLEAQFLSGRNGFRYLANSTLNFIRVD